MFRWEINVQTGERKMIPLTESEIADAQARKVIEDAAFAARQIVEDRKARRQVLLEKMLDELEAKVA